MLAGRCKTDRLEWSTGTRSLSCELEYTCARIRRILADDAAIRADRLSITLGAQQVLLDRTSLASNLPSTEKKLADKHIK